MNPQTLPLRYGSVCSGIEAVSVAWRSLHFEPAWFSEIDPFACAVLAHHFPHVANLGDMTHIAHRVTCGAICAPDILVGGTPCQSFSVAGLRKGLTDPRGALTLKYVELADAIDQIRQEQGQPPAVLVWENVPGVLSDRANAFGCLLGALAGEECELEPAGRSWTNAGCVYGPQRAIAWRVLDAQHFGVAQRRKRVFVVASARQDFDPCAVLFESQSVRRDTPPRPETRQDSSAAASAGPAVAGQADAESSEHVCFGGGNVRGPIDRAACLTARGHRCDYEIETFAVQTLTGAVTHPLTTVHGVVEDGGGRGVPVIAALTYRVESDAWPNDRAPVTLAFAENSRGELRLEGGHGQLTGVLSRGGGKAGQGVPMVASLSLRGRAQGVAAELGGDISPALRASSGGSDKAHVLEAHFECTRADECSDNLSSWSIWRVRRLMPLECERLQGLPDDYTRVPYRGELAADGPRYKAIGNSMAVPCVAWIGERLREALRRRESRGIDQWRLLPPT